MVIPTIIVGGIIALEGLAALKVADCAYLMFAREDSTIYTEECNKAFLRPQDIVDEPTALKAVLGLLRYEFTEFPTFKSVHRYLTQKEEKPLIIP